MDEFHAHKTSEIYDVLVSGMAARENPLIVIITTSGFDLNAPCYKEYQYVSKQLADQGKSISDLSDEEREEWHKKYIQYAKSEKADDIEYFADWYWDIAKATSAGLQGSMDYFQ